MPRGSRLAEWLVVVVAVWAGPLVAADVANLPYRGLCKSMGITFQGDMAQWPGQLPFTLRSELPDVKPADIRLTLQAGDQEIPLPVGEDGRLMLPLERKWFDLDAMIVSNQPQGTLAMSCECNPKLTHEECQFTTVSPHLEDGRIACATLERLAQKSRRQLFERALEKQFGRDVAWRLKAAGKLDELDEPLADPVILLFVKDGKEAATVTVAPPANPFRKAADRWAAVMGRKQEEVVREVGPGMFLVHVPKDATETNPVLVLSDNPTWQCMLMDREGSDTGWPGVASGAGQAPTSDP